MADRLVAVRLKIERAELHRKSIDAEGQEWIKHQTATVFHDDKTEPPWHRLVVNAPAWTEPPLRWGVVLGELVHDLRSALDHTIWQLVLANNRKPGGSNQFPIFSRQPDPARYAPYVTGVADAPKAKIKKLQPYMRPNRTEPEPLEILGSLSNTDKHQTVNAAATVVHTLEHAKFSFTPRGDRAATEQIRWNQSVGKPPHEAELIGVRFDPPEADVEFEPHPHLPISVAFGEGSAVPFAKLNDLIEAVTRVVDLLEPFAR